MKKYILLIGMVVCGASINAQETYLDKLPAELLVKIFEIAPADSDLINEYMHKKDTEGIVYPLTEKISDLILQGLCKKNAVELYHSGSGLTLSPREFIYKPHFGEFKNQKYEYEYIQQKLQTYLRSLFNFYKDAPESHKQTLATTFLKALNPEACEYSLKLFHGIDHSLAPTYKLFPNTLGQMALLLCIQQDHKETHYYGGRNKYPKLCNWYLIKDILVEAKLIPAELRDNLLVFKR